MKKLILDLDTGIDDALAIAFALGNPDVRLVGVLASFGNVTLERSARNALAVLDLLGHPEVPVMLGAAHPLASDEFHVDAGALRVHGTNGLGECAIASSSREPIGAGEDGGAAVSYLLEAVRSYGDELLYVPTGPLTNLALALREDPSVAERLDRVTFMGGALTVPGNVSPFAEANISADPEAADEVLRSGLKMRMVGLDVTHQTLLTRAETARWRDLGKAAGGFLADMTDFYIDAYAENNPHMGCCSLHDPLAVGVALDPSLVTTLSANLRVDLEGSGRGRTIADPKRLCSPRKDCEVAVGVDAALFRELFCAKVGRTLTLAR